MKLNCILIILAIFSAAVFSSCEKPVSEPKDTGTPGTQEKMLSELFIIDSSFSAPFDTISRTKLYYDSSGRYISSQTYRIKAPEFSSVRLEYQGQDSFASRMIYYEKINLGNSVYADTTYYFFNAGKCSKDSIVNGNFYDVSSFLYNDSHIARTRVTRRGTPYIFELSSSKILQTELKGDIIDQIDTLVSSTGSREWQVSTSYLEKPNPFNNLAYPTHLEYFDENYGIGLGAQPAKNLIIQQACTLRSWTAGSSAKTIINNLVNFTYEFDSDGCPIIARETFTDKRNGTIKKLKYLFMYE